MPDQDAVTYPVRTISRLTGLTPDVLRVWERRYAVVTPMRTPGGTRRYSEAELERLQRLKAAVDAGHRIGTIAKLDADSLANLGHRKHAGRRDPVDEVMEGLTSLDEARVERVLSGQLAALGPTRFVRQVAVPLLERMGQAWSENGLGIASEHLGSSKLRSYLGAALRDDRLDPQAPVVLFATLSDERHELGLLSAAVTAMGAGARPLYLGPDLPVAEIARAAERTGAAAVGISLVALDSLQARSQIIALRNALPASVEVWVGGAGRDVVPESDLIRRIDSMLQLEQRIALLRLQLESTPRRLAR